MNIFILDDQISNIPALMSDQHVIKMILESCQILCTVHHMHNTPNVPYKKTHQNHPCVVWAAESSYNYNYVLELAQALSDEYTFRFGKRHKSQDVIDWLNDNVLDIKYSEMTQHVQCVPDDYIHRDPVTAYRDYYTKKYNDFKDFKRKAMRFTKRDVPSFLNSQK